MANQRGGRAAATRRGANGGITPSPSPPPSPSPSPPPPPPPNADEAIQPIALVASPQRSKAPAMKRKASGSPSESKKRKTIHNPKTQGVSKKNRRTQNKKKGNNRNNSKKGNNRNNSKKGKKKKKKSKRK